MDLAERPRNQRPTDPPTTTQKPETTTEDTSNRILSLPNEEKCMKSKFTKIHVKLKLNYRKKVFFPHPFICQRHFINVKVGNGESKTT